ncbi:unnamed protein product [Rhizophagus irregularis]|nr:unnamed protein product [Rhizophagus irregularis]CAB4413349.1 unnamed protein product [Rhizophagus irregularis]
MHVDISFSGLGYTAYIFIIYGQIAADKPFLNDLCAFIEKIFLRRYLIQKNFVNYNTFYKITKFQRPIRMSSLYVKRNYFISEASTSKELNIYFVIIQFRSIQGESYIKFLASSFSIA